MYGDEFVGEPLADKQSTLDNFLREKEIIENYRLTTLTFLSTKKGYLLGVQAMYQHLTEKHKTMISPMIKGSAGVEDCCKDVVNFDEGEYVILIAGTFNKYIVRLYILTSEGKYLEIGGRAKGTGQDFEWKFTKERYFFAFKAAAKEYIVYLSSLYLSADLIHFKPKERTPKKIDLATDLIVKPNLIHKSEVYGKEGIEAYFFDDLMENKFQQAIAKGKFRVEKIDCYYAHNKVVGISVQYQYYDKLIVTHHKSKLVAKGNTLQTSLKLEPGDFVCEISCAFAGILKFLQIKTKNGHRITIGAARESENKYILTDIDFIGRFLAFYGSVENEGIGSLGIYYEKVANKLDLEFMEEEKEKIML